MATIKRFEDLEVWQKAREICNIVLRYIQKYDFSRDFTLSNQIRSSSGSAMDNIAEGFERGGNKEFVQFLSISKGSIGETRSQTYRAFDNKYISEEEFELLKNECLILSDKLGAFINYLKKSGIKGTKFKK